MKKIILALIILQFNSKAQWTAMSITGLPANPDINALTVISPTVFAGTFGGGIYRAAGTNTAWLQWNNGLTNQSIWSLTSNGGTLYTGTQGGGLYTSTNNAVMWVPKNTGLTNLNVKSIFPTGSNVFAGTLGGGSYLSTNNGGSWAAGNTGMTDFYVNAYAAKGSTIFAGNDGSFGKQGGVYLSANNGGTWTAVNSGLPPNTSVHALEVSNTYILAGTIGTGVYFSFNDGASWTQSNLNNKNVLAIVKSGSFYFAATSGGGVYISGNDGGTWTQTNNGLTDLWVTCLAVDANYIYAGTYGKVFYRSINDITKAYENELNETRVSIYPNPFNTTATVEISGNKENKECEFILYDALGRELKKEKSFSGQKINIEKSGFNNGIYFYKLLVDKQQVKTGKLIITD